MMQKFFNPSARTLALTTLIALVLSLPTTAFCQNDKSVDYSTLKSNFQTLPDSAREMTGPLFWLHGDESQEKLEKTVDMVAQSGNGILSTESRPHSDWLGETWYRDVKIVLEQAKKHNMKVIIFDDYWWPSQMMGGRVPAEYGSKSLKAQTFNPADTIPFDQPNLIAVVAGRVVEQDKIDSASLTLIDKSWQAPAGEAWRVMVFWWEFNGTKGFQHRYVSVDGMDKKAVEWFINAVYQPHYDRFKDDFTKNIVGFFFDEPETQGDWGSDLKDYIQQRGLDLKTLLVGYKFKLAGEIQNTAYYNYLDCRAESWGRTMYGGMSQWCRQHNVYSSGHFMEHNFYSPTLCAGNVMQLGKYTDVPGIDLVCRQLYPGNRDGRLYQMPKISSSLAHVYNRHNGLNWCETFGAYGQDITYPQMKWLCDWHQVRGCPFLITHSFNPRAPYDRDCPPYFYNGGEEPRYPLYHVWANYNNRIASVLAGGTHIAPIALVMPGQSLHCGKTVCPENMTSTLQDAQMDCDWILYDALEAAEIVDVNPFRPESKRPALHLAKEYYEILILPAAEIVPYEVLQKAKQFLDKGGIVIGYAVKPSQSATLGKTAQDIQNLTNAIFNQNNSNAVFFENVPSLAQINETLDKLGVLPDVKVVDTTGYDIQTYRCRQGNADVYFICNMDTKNPVRQLNLSIAGNGRLEAWDAMQNTITRPDYKPAEGGRVAVKLELEPSESIILMFPHDNRTDVIEPPQRLTASDLKAGSVVALENWTEQVNRIQDEAPEANELDTAFRKASWIWRAADNQAPCEIWFKTSVNLPVNAKVKSANFVMTCDNAFDLFVNGTKELSQASGTNDWKSPKKSDLKQYFKPGENELLVKGVNTLPGPAGLLGAWKIELESGEVFFGDTSHTWLTSNDKTNWASVQNLGKNGCAPWGVVSASGRSNNKTRSPFDCAVVSQGRFTLPEVKVNQRVFYTADRVEGEPAARVHVNNTDAGGFIGAPYLLDITPFVKPGVNTIQTEPFKIEGGRIVIL